MDPSLKLKSTIDIALTKQQVVDVSNINTDATGIRSISPPTTDRSLKKRIGYIPVVSNNYESYKYAMDLLGPEYSGYADKFLEYHGTGTPGQRVSQIMALPLHSVPQLSPPRVNSPSLLFKLRDMMTHAQREGKVIDVSRLTPNGSGLRTILPPTENSSKKGFPHIVGIVSDNYPNYKFAMEILGNQYLPYADAYLSSFGNKPGSPASPAPGHTMITQPPNLTQTQNLTQQMSQSMIPQQWGTQTKIQSPWGYNR